MIEETNMQCCEATKKRLSLDPFLGISGIAVLLLFVDSLFAKACI